MSVYHQRGIPERWHGARLSKLTPLDGQQEAFDALAAVIPGERHGLYLHGPTGVGKSLLMAARLMDILDGGKLADFDLARYITWRRLIRNQRAQFGDGDKPEDVMSELFSRPLVAVDDLAMGKVTGLAVDIAEELLDARYERAWPIIITTNHDPKALRNLMGARVESRIRRTCRIVHLTGKDRSELR